MDATRPKIERLERNQGFVLRVPRGEDTRVEWELIREIVAFRREPGGEDLICLAFRTSALE
jgi:hypothetical protein